MCEKCAPPEPVPSVGSRRRRLWDLPQACHCPVLGVCLPLARLRELVGKAVGRKAVADDYEVHVGTVAECSRRNRLTELLQDELERRYARQIQRFRAAKTTPALAELWAQAVKLGDVAGPFWAALTHPRCDEALQEALCRDLHMLQHQAGAAVRVDLARFNALASENAVLARELGKAQERCTRVISEKSAELERLHAELLQLRASSLGKDSRIAFLSQDLADLKAAVPGFESISRLRARLEQLEARLAEQESQNARLQLQLAAAQKAARPEPLVPEAVQLPMAPEPVPMALYLQHKTVLCVGGRNGSIANYRELIEQVGARFAHHDGGLEDSPNVLDASLAAADLVICQTGCISHNAYWKVKDFCKRTGKRCVFVENPSSASLARGLAQAAASSALGA